MLQKNQILTAAITDLNNLGFGVAKIDGISVFVADTVTGDIAEIKIIKTAKTYAVGTLCTLITPSPMRAPEHEVCGAAKRCGGNRCGGCVYQRITYAHELALKKQYVTFAMKKAGAQHIKVLDVLTTGQTAAYRNKAQYPVGTEILDGEKHTVIGFYAVKTHKIVPLPNGHCALQPPIFSEIVRFTAHFCDTHQISAYDETSGNGILRHLYLRMGSKTGEILVCLVINADTFPHADDFCKSLIAEFPQVKSIQVNQNRQNTNVILGNTCCVLWGSDAIEDILCGKVFRISQLSFYQVNRDGAELLYHTAKTLLQLQPREALLDLYCGIGTIGLSVADTDTPLVGIEIIPQAVENAKENAKRNGMKNARFFCGDASDAKQILHNLQMHADAVIVDPPRKGLTPAVIAYLGELTPKRIVYISCDADTLARDIMRFAEYGYHTDTTQPVDMFSRTGHVECVALLTKK
ncbi:MAG: 23S rRNA (uracil(1939)-C(5))-methyltransferase RlmD [Clostridia bacterium]|nr:23S rRNA (uracil(1939)-C(5))-methyltransferase RlmD [Clostridia bacterium]